MDQMCSGAARSNVTCCWGKHQVISALDLNRMSEGILLKSETVKAGRTNHMALLPVHISLPSLNIMGQPWFSSPQFGLKRTQRQQLCDRRFSADIMRTECLRLMSSKTRMLTAPPLGSAWRRDPYTCHPHQLHSLLHTHEK